MIPMKGVRQKVNFAVYEDVISGNGDMLDPHPDLFVPVKVT